MWPQIFLIGVLILVFVGCEPEEEGLVDPEEETVLLISSDAQLETVNDLILDPVRDPLPDDSVLAEQIVLGYEIVRNTREFAGEYVGNELSCANCHLNAGQRDRALPFVGISATFPQYRPREDRLVSLEERVRECFARSMNGTQPPYESDELLAVVAYITWLSEGQPVGESPDWRGRNRIDPDALLAIEELDVELGEELYIRECAMCHGLDGQGVDLDFTKAGPLWGPGSWNDGAGLARVYTLAGYIRYTMPLTSPGSLTDEEALQIAAYINSKPRPEFPHKADDFPGGEAPVDAVYFPRYERNPLTRE